MPLNDTNVVFFTSSRAALPVSIGLPSHVEQVVDDLKRQAEVLGVRGQRSNDIGGRAGHDRAGGCGGAEERACLAAMNALERLEADLLIGRQKIDRLAADQSVGPTASARIVVSRLDTGVSYARTSVPIREIEQSKRGENRNRFTEFEVIGLASPTQRRIVHRRQIVEDQRRRVYELHDCGRRHRRRGRAAAQLCREQRQDRPDPLRRRTTPCTPSIATLRCRRR